MDQQTEKEFELQSRKWRHRRFMAYVSLYSVVGIVLIIIGLAVAGYGVAIAEFNSIIIAAIGGFVAIVAAYMGLSTIDDGRRK